MDGQTAALLEARWTKDIEDQTDSLVCALIGDWHWRHGGERTQVLGDRETGFFLIPQI
jgi:predicted RNase H-like nuclease